MAGGRGLRLSCAAVGSLLVIAVLVAIGVIAYSAVSVLGHLVTPRPGSAATSGSESVQPPLLHLRVANPRIPFYAGPSTRSGFDVSYPQCGATLPSTNGGFAIVGIGGGQPITRNNCRGDQWVWAVQQAATAVYVNTSDPGTQDPTQWGQTVANSALFGIRDTGVPIGTPVWLDVETNNVWVGSWQRHVTVLQTMAQTIADAGYPVGIYSNQNLWYTITGNATVNVPTWYATGAGTERTALTYCRDNSFGGHYPSMVQWVARVSAGYDLDHNALCPGVAGTGVVRRTGNG